MVRESVEPIQSMMIMMMIDETADEIEEETRKMFRRAERG